MDSASGVSARGFCCETLAGTVNAQVQSHLDEACLTLPKIAGVAPPEVAPVTRVSLNGGLFALSGHRPICGIRCSRPALMQMSPFAGRGLPLMGTTGLGTAHYSGATVPRSPG